ncbi:hypothetical protein B0H19DRAFT_1068100 [Mycena capillaripes]|nr:hypothetical protein B0H19DRAFT_1068100 [Mycena capillaripes]
MYIYWSLREKTTTGGVPVAQRKESAAQGGSRKRTTLLYSLGWVRRGGGQKSLGIIAAVQRREQEADDAPLQHGCTVWAVDDEIYNDTVLWRGERAVSGDAWSRQERAGRCGELEVVVIFREYSQADRRGASEAQPAYSGSDEKEIWAARWGVGRRSGRDWDGSFNGCSCLNRECVCVCDGRTLLLDQAASALSSLRGLGIACLGKTRGAVPAGSIRPRPLVSGSGGRDELEGDDEELLWNRFARA